MKLIIDNNILFSLMKTDSSASKIFFALNCEFVAPSFVLYEFRKYEEDCIKKSKLSKKDFEIRKEEVFSRIRFIDFEIYQEFIDEAIKNIADENDAPYIALALKMKIPLWSNDKLLKSQNKVNVLSTEDIVELVFG